MLREQRARPLDDRRARVLRVVDERAAEPNLATNADEPQLGDIADFDAHHRALLADVKLRAAEQIEQLDRAAPHRADLEQAALRRDQRCDDRRARIAGRCELAIRAGCRAAITSRVAEERGRCSGYQKGALGFELSDLKKIDVTLTVGKDGTVTDVNLSSHAGDTLGQCLVARIKAWKFRESRGGTFRFALAFGAS